MPAHPESETLIYRRTRGISVANDASFFRMSTPQGRDPAGPEPGFGETLIPKGTTLFNFFLENNLLPDDREMELVMNVLRSIKRRDRIS